MRRVAVSRTTRALGAVPAAVLFAVVSAVLLAIGCAQDPGTDGNPLMGDNNNGGDDASTKRRK